MAELRYHPFLGQWVIAASHRQSRTYFPPDDHCPLCPTTKGKDPTEIPFPTYQVAVFENRFPSLSSPAPNPESPGGILMAAPAEGVCEVVCYTPDHHKTFTDLTHIEVIRLTHVWRDRYNELIRRPNVEYVFIFENRGREIGVTLSHPHGQIYAYPFIPPLAKARLHQEQEHWESHGTNLTDEWLSEELAAGTRILKDTESFVALCPYFARFPFEVHVVAKNPRRSLADMQDAELESLAALLLELASAYDALFGFPLPYIMAMHQFEAEFTRFRIEFTPLHRSENKLKFLAGSETAMGAFIVDVLPEDAANRLRTCWPQISVIDLQPL